MSDLIKLVSGDQRPYVTLTLTDSNSGTAIDVSDATTTVRVYFRAAGTTTVLSTLTCTKPNGGSDGVVRFYFVGTTLNVPAGRYEGEVEIDFNGEKQTLYDVLKFAVRSQFA